MTISADDLKKVVSELSVLAGGRVQRVDLVAEREAIIELRVPGRTLRLLVSARRSLGRVHLVDKRPVREVPPGPVQAKLRQRLAGQRLLQISAVGRTFFLDVPTARFQVRLDGGRDAFRLLPPVAVEPPEEVLVPTTFPISDAIALRYRDRIPAATEAALRDRLLAIVAGRRKKLARLAANINRDVTKLEAMQKKGANAELMKTELHRIPRGATEVEVTDWVTSATVKISLDPTLGAKSNMARLFNRAKKAARGLPIATKRLAQVQARIDDLDADRARIEGATPDALESMARLDVGALGGLDGARLEQSERAATPKTRPVDRWSRLFLAVDGTSIRVGRGAKENDRLTFSHAKADDIWLHTRGTSGAHVVLDNPKGRSPSQEALLDAAHLAVFYSSAKTETKAEVIYTEARYVRKTKGAPPGQVGVAKSKTMLVRIDTARLDRLLGRTGPTGLT